MSKKGHHGGAWKVAYADFVTAMMALFMVLWLTSQDQRIKEAVERAFRNPFSSVTKESVGIIPSKEMTAVKSTSGNFDSASAVELNMLRRINQDLIKSLQGDGESEDQGAVKLDMTPDGLRINVFDRAHKPIFEPQTTKFTTYGDWVFSTLAWEISRYTSFAIELEGHTETGNAPLRDDYGDWEVSSGLRQRGAAQVDGARSGGPADKKSGWLRQHGADAQPGAGRGNQSSRDCAIERPIQQNLSKKDKAMSAEFVPLLAPVATSKNPVSASPHVKIFPQTDPNSVFEPLIPAAPASSHSAEVCSKPTITLERNGDVISAIRVQCACGNVIELNCLH